MDLLVFIARRLGFLLVTLAVVSILIFAITQLLPGDVATMILGLNATPEDLATIRRQLGLDRPAVVQYLDWASGVLSGDLGISTRFKQPVADVLWGRIVNSARLAGLGLVIAVPAGIGLGVWTALRQGRASDHAVSGLTLFAAAMPEFVTGAVLIVVFSSMLGLFPPFSSIEAGMSLGEQLHRLALPAIALNLVILAYIQRMMRASMIEVLDSTFIRAAVLKGLTHREIILRHALPLALGPTMMVLGLSIGWMAGGLVVVESMFGYPGLGRLLVFAIQNRDIPMIQAISLVVAAVYALANLMADVAQRILDPRTIHA